MGEDESGVRSDPLITKLRQASKTGSIVQFVGYLDVSEDGVVRLFDDLSFESYVELRRADVIEFMEVPREGVNRHRVFLPGSANVRRVVGVNTRADATGTGGCSPGRGPGCVVARWDDRGYYRSYEGQNLGAEARDACESVFDARIRNLRDWIDILNDINDGRFDGLIADLTNRIETNRNMRDSCREIG